MKKRRWLLLPLVLMGLCLQTALAQQSPAASKRVPQLTSEDLTAPPAASPEPVEDVVPAPARSAAGWSRHQFADLGLSLEFFGKPPAAVARPMPTPAGGDSFAASAKAHGFTGPGWDIHVVQLVSKSSPTYDDVVNFAAGVGDGMGVTNPEFSLEQKVEPRFRINGVLNRNGETREVRMRFMTQGKRIWAVVAQCRQSEPKACAAARHTIDSVSILP